MLYQYLKTFNSIRIAIHKLNQNLDHNFFRYFFQFNDYNFALSNSSYNLPENSYLSGPNITSIFDGILFMGVPKSKVISNVIV